MTIEFSAWPKTQREFRDIIVSEKIDGTNAAIIFTEDDEYNCTSECEHDPYIGDFAAQSRNRMITPGQDNAGFAGWAYSNAFELFKLLGPGRHYGEWWGAGIQRKYGQTTKNFSLFNADKWADLDAVVGGVPVRPVPVLYRGPNDHAAVQEVLHGLNHGGSVAAPGFYRPEGICIYHTAGGYVTKVTLDSNDAGKWEL